MNREHQTTNHAAEELPPPVAADLSSDAEMEDVSSGGDDLFDEQQIKADANQSQIRLDKFLMDRLSNRSRNKIQEAIRSG
jgi:hypothetical protein